MLRFNGMPLVGDWHIKIMILKNRLLSRQSLVICLPCFLLMISLPLNADFYTGEKLNIDGDARLKLIAIDELPLDAGVKLPELNYTDVVFGAWATWQPTDNILYKAWIKTEFRNYTTNKQVNNYRFLDELVFHELSVEYANLFDGFVDIKLGRFPLYYGHGLLILESSPLDAERSYGFNGIKTRLNLEGFNLDLIGIYSPKEDELLINNKNKQQGFLESDEEGFVAYLTNKTQPWLPKDLYYMYKHEEPRFGKEDVYFHTAGFIWESKRNDAFTAYWELAGQRGHRRGAGDTRGWLSDMIFTYTWSEYLWKPELFVSNYFLSGDDPSTETEEGWHGLWARWPQYSYLLVWQFIPKIGEWSNINWSRIGTRFYPSAASSVELSFGPVKAPEKGPGGGNDRGDLLVMVYTQSLGEKLSMAVRTELLESGDYHPDVDNISWESRVDFKYSF